MQLTAGVLAVLLPSVSLPGGGFQRRIILVNDKDLNGGVYSLMAVGNYECSRAHKI